MGTWPSGGVVRDAAGNLYGATEEGGAADQGGVFKIDATGQATLLHSFTGGPDGAKPSGVIRDDAGNLYGTAEYGGTNQCGLVFKLDPAGHETVLYRFTCQADGGYPWGGVVRDAQGNLYGTTLGGGLGYGGVFKIGSAGQESMLYSFTGAGDGGYPTGGIIRDAAGNLYGTATGGSPVCNNGCGVVFQVDATGHQTVLHTFAGADGEWPNPGLVIDPDGNLYGTTEYGNAAGFGEIFKIGPSGQFTVLYSFTGADNGGDPAAGLLRDAAGNLYGTNQDGGGPQDCYQYIPFCGVAFELSKDNQFTVLYDFATQGGGGGPNSQLIMDPDGNLYGTTDFAPPGFGEVYKIDPAGHQSVPYFFGGSPDGRCPGYSGVVLDSLGNLYGTTFSGGLSNWGVVYKMDPAGNETVLHDFTGGTDGAGPFTGVTLDSAGNVYGTTNTGGSANLGVVYKLDPTGHETILHSFTGGLVDGASPGAGVVLDAAGNIYGTTTHGGNANLGVVYQLYSSGFVHVLHNFTGGIDGGLPFAGVTLDANGNLYGTTFTGGTAGQGAVYKLDAAGHESLLYSFTGGSDGGHPCAGVILDPAGNLYGTTTQGGAKNRGVVFKLDPTGHLTVLHSILAGTADSLYGVAGVVRDAAGNLYGTVKYGGGNRTGVVYELNSAGDETVLYEFTGATDGGLPGGGVVLDAAGNIYGTTAGGGPKGGGLVFKLTP